VARIGLIRRAAEAAAGGAAAIISTIKAGFVFTQRHSLGSESTPVNPAVSIDATRQTNRIAQTPAFDIDTRVDSAEVAKPAINPAIDIDARVASAQVAKPDVNPAFDIDEGAVGKTFRGSSQIPAFDVDTRVDSAQVLKPEPKPAFDIDASLRDLTRASVPQNLTADILQVTYSLTHRRGGTATDVGGADNWTSTNNASHGVAGVATSTGEALNARTREMQIAYNNFVNKSELTITAVRLHFYVSQGGTVANNGDLRLRYNSGGGLVTLDTYTDNQNFLTTPKTYDLFALGVDTWTELDALVAQVEHRTDVAEALVTASVDTVEVEVVANRTDTL
jgi:hypothetical protein